MGGPRETVDLAMLIPPGEEQRIFSAASLAWRVENFEVHYEGYIASIRGPCPYEMGRDGETLPMLGGSSVPSRTGTAAPRIHSIFHAELNGGVANVLLLRVGKYLYSHAGWKRGFDDLSAANGLPALSSDVRPRFPDQYVVVNDRIVFTNGVDRAVVIDGDGVVLPLGFSEVPAAPEVRGPDQPDDRGYLLPNSEGYSWPGRIGTVGDELSADDAKLLHGRWYYYVQWEDAHGNLSPLSRPSESAVLFTQKSKIRFTYWYTTSGGNKDSYEVINDDIRVDDLLRQFAVMFGGDAPSNAVAMRLYRSADAVRHGRTPLFHSRVEGTATTVMPDDMPDSALGDPPTDYAPVPVFRVMTQFQGRLAIGNFPGDPGMVRLSEKGYPGSFPKDLWIYPDEKGGEITALFEHGGRLLAATDGSLYDVSDMQQSRPVTQGVGVAAPNSVVPMRDGSVIWLARDGFYRMSGDGAVSLVSGEIDKTIREEINRSRLRLAAATFDPRTGEYVCAVCPAGSEHQTLLLRYDGKTWRRQTENVSVNGICTTRDWRQLVLITGVNALIGSKPVMVLGHEIDPTIHDPGAREAVYRSAWLRAGMPDAQPVHVRGFYIGLVDGSDATATVTFFRDGSWKPVGGTSELRLVGPDNGSGVVTDIAGEAVIGTSKVHARRVQWRWVSAEHWLQGVHSWAFEIRTTAHVRIAAFSFDVMQASGGKQKLRTASASDV